jgi:hypothetical protein
MKLWSFQRGSSEIGVVMAETLGEALATLCREHPREDWSGIKLLEHPGPVAVFVMWTGLNNPRLPGPAAVNVHTGQPVQSLTEQWVEPFGKKPEG